MFSSLFGGRKGPKKGRGVEAPVITGPHDAADVDDGTVLATGGAQKNGRRRRLRSQPRSDGHSETLESVILSQKRRARGCQRLAEKAEALRDSSDDADTVAEQEGIRKSQIDLWIVLTAQINVLERVAAETDIYATTLNEDLDAADVRQAREEEEYHRNQDALRAQQQQTEETSYLISRSTEMPLDDNERVTMDEIDEFTTNEFLPARHD